MQQTILSALEDGIRVIEQLKFPHAIQFIENCAYKIASCFQRKNKILIAGNGGSLCDASHFAEELTGQFRKPRAALPAIALNDPGFLTCTGNDMGFEHVFSRGIAALAQTGDIFIGLTTSGNSLNLIKGFEEAKKRGLETIAFLGKGGGKLKGVADLELIIEGFSTSDRVQEAHMTAIHILIEMVENILFYSKKTHLSQSLDLLSKEYSS